MNTIDRDSPLPLYYQLKRILLRQIQDGDIIPGETIPSETELQERYGVSRITVRRALGDLASEGFISRRPGRGTFVLKPKVRHTSEGFSSLRDELVAQGFEVGLQILQFDLQSASHRIAQKLHIDEGQPILYFQRLISANGEPIVLVTVYLDLGEGMIFTREEVSNDSIYSLLERKYGIIVQHADRTIEATVALDTEAQLLHVKPSAPMLLTESIVYDARDKPTAIVKALCRGDRYKYYCRVTR